MKLRLLSAAMLAALLSACGSASPANPNAATPQPQPQPPQSDVLGCQLATPIDLGRSDPRQGDAIVLTNAQLDQKIKTDQISDTTRNNPLTIELFRISLADRQADFLGASISDRETGDWVGFAQGYFGAPAFIAGNTQDGSKLIYKTTNQDELTEQTTEVVAVIDGQKLTSLTLTVPVMTAGLPDGQQTLCLTSATLTRP